jgi:hypothetical protein
VPLCGPVRRRRKSPLFLPICLPPAIKSLWFSSSTWASNGPRAALYKDGAIVGNYSNGPTWRHNDGSSVTGKVVVTKDSPTSKDYPWQRFEVTSRGQGALSDVTAVVQIDTQKGLLQGDCTDETVGAGQPFRATYVFLKTKK